jgi:hypothetical protein
MKKTLSAVLLAFFLMGSVPSLAYATSSSSNSTNSASISSLLEQISALMRQINDLQSQVKTLRGNIQTVVKEERKEDREERKEERKKEREEKKNVVLVKCENSDGTFSMKWNAANGKGKHKGEWKKFTRYCKKNGTGTSTDNVAPSISSLAVSNITANSAVVTWVTNEASNSVVSFGTTTQYGSTSTVGTLVTNHSVTLTGLSASTLYNFVVRSSDSAGNMVVSSNVTFTTLASTPVDSVSPVISSITVSSITASGATITWTTNESADTQVVYGTTSAYGSTTTLDSTLVTSHSVVLTGLSSSTLYNFAVRSKDASANLAVSSNVSFTTSAPADTTAPVISAISAIVGSTTVTVNWTTNENSTTKVYYGTVNPIVLGSATTLASASLLTAHALTLSGLATSTTYYYVVESVDGASNVGTSSQQSFTTGN